VAEHDPEKWRPVFGKDHAQTRNHDPEPKDRVSEKWRPVFAPLTFGSEKIVLKQEIKQ
jgi:hypothetical protein